MPYLLVGDVHLTDRPRDDYRFGIFDWIKEQQGIHKPDATFLMGDLTDQKDRHSAELVNRIVLGLHKLEDPVFVIKGNHDYTDPANPFFNFLNLMNGAFFISAPEVVLGRVAIIPHIRDEIEFEGACTAFHNTKLDLLLLHNTMQGAIAETGAPLNGFKAIHVKQSITKLGCYAGDVHKPQVAGPVTYVGAPYHIRFGDDFEPRCLLVHENGRNTNLYFEAPHKAHLIIKEVDELFNGGLVKGDHVKVTVELLREEVPEWPIRKQAVLDMCAKLGLVVYGVDLKVNGGRQAESKAPKSHQPADIVTSFCKNENASTAVKNAGLRLLEE